MKSQFNPDPIISGEVDVSDLPTQYTEGIETFRQVLNIPNPRDSVPVSSTLVIGLNKVAQKQELSPRGPFTFLPANPSFKEALENLN